MYENSMMREIALNTERDLRGGEEVKEQGKRGGGVERREKSKSKENVMMTLRSGEVKEQGRCDGEVAGKAWRWYLLRSASISSADSGVMKVS